MSPYINKLKKVAKKNFRGVLGLILAGFEPNFEVLTFPIFLAFGWTQTLNSLFFIYIFIFIFFLKEKVWWEKAEGFWFLSDQEKAGQKVRHPKKLARLEKPATQLGWVLFDRSRSLK